MPHALVAAAVALSSLGSKLLARVTATQARALFRQAERARRYDFEQRALGWPVPGRVHADLLLAFSTKVEHMAVALAKKDDDYFADKGPPGTTRFVWNLAESIFWSEKLLGIMALRRAWQLGLALTVIVGTLAGLVLVEPSGLLEEGQVKVVAVVGVKVVAAFASLLVALDLGGELAAYRRGAGECRDFGAALERALDPPDREEGVRILIEYSCLLADLPMVPDEVHRENHQRLSRLWAEAAERMPGRRRT